MPRLFLKPNSHREIDPLNAVLSLRWLLLFVSICLIVYSDLLLVTASVLASVGLAFVVTNLFYSLAPRGHVVSDRPIIAGADAIFISVVLFLLRSPGNYLYLFYLLIVVWMIVWPDLRLLIFASISSAVTLAVIGFRGSLAERPLVLSLFFVVSIFYIFLSHHFFEDDYKSSVEMEQSRLVEVMVEMTRAVSSSLNTDDVLYAIASRLQQTLDATESAIVRIDPKTKVPRMTKASKPEEPNIEINLDDFPELNQALAAKHILFFSEAKPLPIIAIPMVVNAAVLGLIEIRGPKWMPASNETNIRFFEVMASTAANALRNAQLFEEVEQRARTDYLTGLANHRFFQATLAVEVGRAQRHERTFSLLMIDLDFLKSVNDQFGHPSGDTVIRASAETIRKTCREIDFPARYGGEEFTVILPDTPLMSAVQVADRIREAIGAQDFPPIGRVTASIGVANYPLNGNTKEDLIRVADQALYKAKSEGRNRVAYFNEPRTLD
jgi:diguanylate cyclase (GGDEF)-like protein